MNFEEFTKKWEIREDLSAGNARFFNKELGVFPEQINFMLEDFIRAIDCWSQQEEGKEISHLEMLLVKTILILRRGRHKEGLLVFQEAHTYVWDCLIELASTEKRKEEK